MPSPPASPKTLFRARIRAAQLVQVARLGEAYKVGADMNVVEVIEDGVLVVGHDGNIVDVGPADTLMPKYQSSDFETDVHYSQGSVVPGFVDAHTHPVWAGDRVNEFKMKLAGATYMDVHKAGGGIGFTVRHTKEASQAELLRSFKQRLHRMLRQGTTLVEAKSGSVHQYSPFTSTHCTPLHGNLCTPILARQRFARRFLLAVVWLLSCNALSLNDRRVH